MAFSEMTFQVKGSSTAPYEVTFIKDGESLTAICTCPAGQYGNFCKHRIAILDGDDRAIVSANADKVPTIGAWLEGTDVASALNEYREIENSADTPKSVLVAAMQPRSPGWLRLRSAWSPPVASLPVSQPPTGPVLRWRPPSPGWLQPRQPHRPP